MRRKIYDRLVEWKNERQGSTALLVEGARRVGKSYIVEEFAKNEYGTYLLINFSKVSPDLRHIFSDPSDIGMMLEKLSIATKTKFVERDTLIIFDEVQAFPIARQTIKFLVEDGRYDYIETGSLISIHENVADIVIPSEEEKIEMFPMDFEEFCWAIGDEMTVPYIRKCFESGQPVGPVHASIMETFRQYMIIGGMPMAVREFAEKHSFEKAEIQKKAILSLYREDIGKKTKHNKTRVTAIFDELPSQLNKHDKRFSLSDVTSDGRFLRNENALFWLQDSMIANVCFNSREPSVGLMMNIERTSMKCYMGDTGLLVTMSVEGDEDIYRSLLLDTLHVNEGMFVENVIAQILRANGHKLFFHSFYHKKSGKNRYEIDFLIRDGNKIAAVEVKSGENKRHRSLDIFAEKYSKSAGKLYVLCPSDLKKEGNVTYLPLYMAICL